MTIKNEKFELTAEVVKMRKEVVSLDGDRVEIDKPCNDLEVTVKILGSTIVAKNPIVDDDRINLGVRYVGGRDVSVAIGLANYPALRDMVIAWRDSVRADAKREIADAIEYNNAHDKIVRAMCED